MKKIENPRFNYIITIHNKEDMIKDVISAILMCCRDNSYIYAVLDGCTDNTEKIIDEIISNNNGVPIKKVYAPDVHELLSINIGLKSASQEGYGFNIILQDDVILADYDLEKKVIRIYEWDENLGFISFRLGANFKKDAYSSKEAVPMTDQLESIYGHGISDAKPLLPGHFAYRQIPIKSPVCIPFKLVRKIGMLNEKLAPYGNDDLEYSIRCYKHNFKNGVLALKFYSDIKWGTTRVKPHPKMSGIHYKNMDNIRKWYSEDLKRVCKADRLNKVYKVPGMATENEVKEAMRIWKDNQVKLQEFEKKQKKQLITSYLYRNVSMLLRKISNIHKQQVKSEK